MEKFSLYEILSFLLPGFVLIGIVQLYQKYVFGFEHLLFSSDSKFSESIILLCLSLFVGVLLHFFTFWILGIKKNNWINKIVKPSVKTVSENKSIQKILLFLFNEYKLLNKDNSKLNGDENDIEDLFHFAYFYLETNNKISAAKNFQSLYFWFRNMFTISCVLAPFSIIILAITLIKGYTCYHIDSAITIMIVNIFMLIILSPISRRLREKFIEKIFWSFYVEMIFKNEKNNKQ